MQGSATAAARAMALVVVAVTAAVATAGGKPGTVNDQDSAVACVRAEEKQG